ncbi:hypothetical protein [Variovorax paradoxus]|uniref:Uncharacterized protein n=1 Tax=Variovorax paradoxus TaxID=34073 RepID=A0A679JIG1_VARPD|nr:hypothetical protein VVAX_03562 [Variovorax paradoxus]
MNCKPGDLALTHGAPIDNDILAEVLELREVHGVYGQLWLIRSLGSPFHITPTTRHMLVVWPDKMLRPIRDPGDDAVDEMLLLVGAPEAATA